MHEPIYAQYRLTSRMCMRIARSELQLLRVSQVLQDVMLGGRTTVVNSVIDSIKHQLRVHQEVRAARLQDDLQEAASEALAACASPGADALHGLQFGCATTHVCESCRCSLPSPWSSRESNFCIFIFVGSMYMPVFCAFQHVAQAWHPRW